MQIGLIPDQTNYCLGGTMEFSTLLLNQSIDDASKVDILKDLASTQLHKKQERLCIQTFIYSNKSLIIDRINNPSSKDQALKIIAQIKAWKIEG